MGTRLDVEDKLTAWTAELQRLLVTKQLARQDAQRHLEEYETRVARYDQQIEEIEDSLRTLPTLQATAASLRVARPQMIGRPVLVWVDPSATTIEGPSVMVFPQSFDETPEQEPPRTEGVLDEERDGVRPPRRKKRPFPPVARRTALFDEDEDEDDEDE